MVVRKNGHEGCWFKNVVQNVVLNRGIRAVETPSYETLYSNILQAQPYLVVLVHCPGGVSPRILDHN